MHLFSNRSHVMSQYDKNKKVAHEMQLSLFQLSVIKMEQNSKQRNSSRGVKKNEGDYSTVYYCALFYLLKPRTSYLQLSGSLMLLACLISFVIYNCTEPWQHGNYLFYLIKGLKLSMVTLPMHLSSDSS